MPENHHTYESIHQEHHAWRKYLLSQRKDLSELEARIKKCLDISDRPEDHIICNELESRRALLITEIDNKLKSLTETDALMSKTSDSHQLVSQELFLINSRMRAGLLEFDNGCNRLHRDVDTLS